VTVAKLENVRKVYRRGDQEFAALQGVDLEIRQGEFLAIIGPSGSGKSTLMHLLGCLDSASPGTIEICGIDARKARADDLARIRNKKLGFVFQAFNLLPKLDVVANIELPLLYTSTSQKERKKKAIAAAESVGLGDRLHHRPTQLSGGQCQRVAVARALVNDPMILFGDEPTGNLDSTTGEKILQLFRDLSDQGRTVVLVTHDPSVAEVARRVIEIRDGKISREYNP